MDKESTLVTKMLSTWMSDWLRSHAIETKGLNQLNVLNKTPKVGWCVVL